MQGILITAVTSKATYKGFLCLAQQCDNKGNAHIVCSNVNFRWKKTDASHTSKHGTSTSIAVKHTYHSSQTALYFSPPLLIIFAFFAFQFNLFFLFLLFSLFVFWTLLPLHEFDKLRLFCFYHLFYHSVVITWE